VFTGKGTATISALRTMAEILRISGFEKSVQKVRNVQKHNYGVCDCKTFSQSIRGEKKGYF